MADETQDAYAHTPDGYDPPTNYGGISGSGVYAVISLGRNADAYRLCGFVYEEGIGHTLMVAHADHINTDGTIH